MDLEYLKKTALFKNMTDTEIRSALKALQADEKSYARNETILHAGTRTDRMGLVLSGNVRIESTDIWGNRTLLNKTGPGHYFAESYALLPEEPMLVDAVADEDCRILFLKVDTLGSADEPVETWKAKAAANLLGISVRKNLSLSGRSFHTSPKTIRGRVMAYLNSVSLKARSNEFDIPFDRQQLADYLNLERSALSKELGKMRRDKILSFRKNHFILHKTQ